MTELLESIGHNIRRLRDERGWNQTELGFRADASPSIISLIENGKRNPSTATLAKIAGALDVEVVDLFPKATAPPPEASFDELMDAERRGGATDADIIKDFESITRDYRMSWRSALEALAAPWEERLRSGAFDRSMVEQFFTDVAAISPGVALALSTGTTDTLLQSKYKPAVLTAEDFEEIEKTGLTYAAAHIIAISDKVYAAAAEKFAQSELEAVRQKRDEARLALRDAA
jgi:transcriptional regulator with XRE-family HTH domain